MLKTFILYGCLVTTHSVDFVKQEEGLRLDRYKDAHGWSIGYGRFTSYNKGRKRVTPQEAEHMLLEDLHTANAALQEVSPVPLTQGQCTALQSLIYNIGEGAFKRSTVYAALQEGDLPTVRKSLRKFVYSKGKRLKGLVHRRKREAALFNQ